MLSTPTPVFPLAGEKQAWAEPKPAEVRLIPKTGAPVKPYTSVPAQLQTPNDSEGKDPAGQTSEAKENDS